MFMSYYFGSNMISCINAIVWYPRHMDCFEYKNCPQPKFIPWIEWILRMQYGLIGTVLFEWWHDIRWIVSGRRLTKKEGQERTYECTTFDPGSKGGRHAEHVSVCHSHSWQLRSYHPHLDWNYINKLSPSCPDWWLRTKKSKQKNVLTSKI